MVEMVSAMVQPGYSERSPLSSVTTDSPVPTATPLPNFLIVGAAKAGTTSLYAWLRQHPQVFLPTVKEPCYFVEGYRGGFHDWAEYLDLFRSAVGYPAIGEASTAYLSAPESAAWIRRCLGDVRIVITLRNPIDRAWSMYSWMAMEGYESIAHFDAALHAEVDRRDSARFRATNPEFWRDYLYFEAGLYCAQVQRYLATFSQVHLIVFDDLVAQPAEVFADLCAFLGVDPGVRPVFSAENRSRLPRLMGAQYALGRVRDAIRGLPIARPIKRAPLAVLSGAMDLNVRVGYRQAMPSVVRTRLRLEYAGEVARLAGLLGRDLSQWTA
jgi:hypothetical protein